MLLKFGIAFVLSLGFSISQAADFSREVDGWTIFRSDGSESCFMSMEYEGRGDTEVAIFTRLDKELNQDYVLFVTNGNWSAKEDTSYSLEINLDNESYSANAKGTKVDEKSGFSLFVPREFVRDFAAAKSMKIFLGETLVDALSLKGSGAAVGMLDVCFAPVLTEKRRFRHIATDPFKAD